MRQIRQRRHGRKSTDSFLEMKTDLKRRCLKRIGREKRERMLNTLRARKTFEKRNAFDSVNIERQHALVEEMSKTLQSEIRLMCMDIENKENADCWAGDSDEESDEMELTEEGDSEENVELLALMDEIISNEMKMEALQLVELYEEVESLEDARVLEDIDSHDRLATSEDAVLCPVCQRFDLIHVGSVFRCQCDFRLDTGGDSLTLKDFKRNLQEACSEHGLVCHKAPGFSLQTHFGTTALFMECAECSTLAIVI